MGLFIIYYFIGLIVDFLIAKSWICINSRRKIGTFIYTFLGVFASYASFYYIIMDFQDILLILVFSLGSATGSVLAILNKENKK